MKRKIATIHSSGSVGREDVKQDDHKTMAHTVIHLFGASGSGTTTLGKYICRKIGGFFMDTDDYYWMPVDPPYTV